MKSLVGLCKLPGASMEVQQPPGATAAAWNGMVVAPGLHVSNPSVPDHSLMVHAATGMDSETACT